MAEYSQCRIVGVQEGLYLGSWDPCKAVCFRAARTLTTHRMMNEVAHIRRMLAVISARLTWHSICGEST